MSKQTISILPIGCSFIGEVLKTNTQPKQDEYLETWITLNYNVFNRQLVWDIIRKLEAVHFTNICSEWVKTLSFGYEKREIVGEDEFGSPVYEDFIVNTYLGQALIRALFAHYKNTLSYD